MDKAEIQTRIEQVTNYIQDCERRISQGEVVNLLGLDESVEEVCEAVTALPPKDGKLLQEKLAGLVEALDQLAIVIHEFHEKNESI